MTWRTFGKWGGLLEKDFLEWLAEQPGVTLLPADFEADLIVYDWDGEVCRVQDGLTRHLRWFGSALAHYNTFRGVLKPKPLPIEKRLKKKDERSKKVKRKHSKVDRLRLRDGDCCFYCGKVIPPGEETLEHLLSQAVASSHPGTAHVVNSLDNLVLAHEQCNNKAGNLPVALKIQLRDELRKEARHDHDPCAAPAG